MSIDRIQLNAAIDALVESKGFSQEARQMIYEFGLSLPSMSRVAGSVQMEKPGDSFTGHTQEHGDVQFQNDQNEVKKLDFGGEPARIGSYKVWRESEKGGHFSIAIGHFWNSMKPPGPRLKKKPGASPATKTVPSGSASARPSLCSIISESA